MSYFCPICDQKWKAGQKSIQCTSCLGWIHHNNRINYSGLIDTEFENHCNDDNKPWECDKCIANSFFNLPFSDLDDNNWLNLNEIIPGNNLSEDINIIKYVNLKQIFLSQCEDIQNLNNLENDDDDDNFSTHVNSKYYDINQLNSLKLDLPSSFDLFHVNIASLNKHIDDLKCIISSLNYKFDIIGISEHKILKDTLPSNNTRISGYHEFDFEPTETFFGGTGFYIKDNLDYFRRTDLKINAASHYESMFIEIVFPKKKNLIVGCI